MQSCNTEVSCSRFTFTSKYDLVAIDLLVRATLLSNYELVLASYRCYLACDVDVLPTVLTKCKYYAGICSALLALALRWTAACSCSCRPITIPACVQRSFETSQNVLMRRNRHDIQWCVEQQASPDVVSRCRVRELEPQTNARCSYLERSSKPLLK